MELKRYGDFIKKSNENNQWEDDFGYFEGDYDDDFQEGDFQVVESMILNGKFIKDKIPDEVKGFFYCSGVNLTSLEGSPKKIGKDFFCQNNKLTSLKGGPKKVEGDFDCSENLLTSLEGGPSEVKGHFRCFNNQLTSLDECPKEVIGDFYCDNNQLTSLKGMPSEIEGHFHCNDNKLTSLKGSPTKIKGMFYCYNNKLISLEYYKCRSTRLIVDDYLEIEKTFVDFVPFKKYWPDLLKYCISSNIKITDVLGWPDYIKEENKDLFKSLKGISKFNL